MLVNENILKDKGQMIGINRGDCMGGNSGGMILNLSSTTAKENGRMENRPVAVWGAKKKKMRR